MASTPRATRLPSPSTKTAAVKTANQEVAFQKELIKALGATAGKIPTLEKVF
jgi:hypothetical protein